MVPGDVGGLGDKAAFVNDSPILAHPDLAGLCESRFGEPDLARQWGISTLHYRGQIKWPANLTELGAVLCRTALDELEK